MFVFGAAMGQADTIPAEWGPLWQPALPARERHPYLFFDARDHARMLTRIKREPYARWWARIGKDRSASDAAFVWWLTGDEDAAQRARDRLVKHRIGRKTEPNREKGIDEISLEPSSHGFADYVFAYDLLAAWKGLSPEDSATIRGRIAEEANAYCELLETVRGGRFYGNQRTLGASALGMAALALCNHSGLKHTPREWLTRALHEIRREENFLFFRPGGLFIEGRGYSDYMALQFVRFAVAYERATGRFLLGDPRLREWLLFAAYQTKPNGQYIHWGTCDFDYSKGLFCMLANRRYGRARASLFRHEAAKDAKMHEFYLCPAIALYDDDVTAPMPPASRAFLPSGMVVLRSGWGRDSLGVWFGGKNDDWPRTGPRAYWWYSHADTGHFVLVAHDELLANDSAYDHWKSKDYYDATFHNVPMIDGMGPDREQTMGTLSNAVTAGPVQHATVTARLQDCTWRRTLALVRGRYVIVADRFEADREHEYEWQIRSACPPDFAGTQLAGRQVTWAGVASDDWLRLWSGRDSDEWQRVRPGKTQLTVIAPPFAKLRLEKGRWMPFSWKPEFTNQVAVAKWRAASTTALFVLIPNLRANPAVAWQALPGQNIELRGPGWTDQVTVSGTRLDIGSTSPVGLRASVDL
ncbi:MAG: heparinase II/III family protein [Kiritimatiellae bacterium]|nr:heparinase II/III family protein [Kiritimatiellia bacterium]